MSNLGNLFFGEDVHLCNGCKQLIRHPAKGRKEEKKEKDKNLVGFRCFLLPNDILTLVCHLKAKRPCKRKVMILFMSYLGG